MSRVSENSSTASIKYTVNRSKEKLEDLQLKGTSLRRMTKPSDDPIGNIELMKLRTNKIENDQFGKNANLAMTSLDYIENSIKDLTEIMVKGKEIAVAQSSDLFNPEVRKSVAKEISQLHKQALGIANRRLGSRYIFSGHKTLERPFSTDGKYLGDKGVIYLEILKDFYVPTNLPGNEVFYINPTTKSQSDDPLKDLNHLYSPQNLDQPLEDYSGKTTPKELTNSLFTEDDKQSISASLFDSLAMLENGLVTNNPDVIQGLLHQFDSFIDHLITLRTRIGSTSNTVMNSASTLSDNDLFNATRKSKLEDADIAELFSDLIKQEQLLKATYKTSAKLINENLLDFLR